MDMNQGATADAVSPSGHPGTVPLNPKQISFFIALARASGEFHIAKVGEPLISLAEWRVRELKRWREHSERLLAGAG